MPRWLLKILLYSTIGVFNSNLKAQGLGPQRLVDWSNAGIDSNSLPAKWDTVNVTGSMLGLDSTGSLPCNVALQNALADTLMFPNPTVFFFPAGRYLLSSVISLPNNRILRGTGSDSTYIISESSTHCFTIGKFSQDSARTVIGNPEKGDTTIRLSSITGLSPGDYVDLYQANDSLKMWTLNPGSWDQVWAKDSKGLIARIEAIDTITKSIRLHHALPFGLTDLMGKGYVRLTKLPVTSTVGFEDFTLIANNSSMTGHSFYFRQAVNSWICGIESAYTRKYHVATERCADLTVRGSYFHHSYNYGGGGSGYGVECGFHTSRVLVYNNIFNTLRHALLLHLGANSNVYSYNYSTNPFWTQLGTPADLVLHGHYPLFNLFESNVVQQITVADYWGPAGPGNTFLRNRIASKRLSVQDRSHLQNIIGNELPPAIGGISISGGVDSTIIHGNRIGMNVTYDSNYSKSIETSYYLRQKPCFLQQAVWPLIGPEYSYGTYGLPAERRFLNSKKTLSCTCSPSTGIGKAEEKSDLTLRYDAKSNSIFINSLEGSSVYRFELFGTDGRSIYSGIGNGHTVSLWEKLISSGIYIYRLTMDSKRYTGKLVIRQ